MYCLSVFFVGGAKCIPALDDVQFRRWVDMCAIGGLIGTKASVSINTVYYILEGD
jgi:hypothetical protein